jgi:predicted aldo/keto reductase-like oxidoreductase
MEKVSLGRTGLKVSKWALGGIPLSTVMGSTTEEKIDKVIHAALDLGVNLIDTSRVYMDSETNIGKVMATRRKECYLATKSHLRTRDEVLSDVEQSLKELQTDRIDIYQLHEVEEKDVPVLLGKGGGLEGLKKARDEGMIDYIGVTGHIPPVLIEFLKTGEFDTVMLAFNVIEREVEAELIPLAKEQNVGTLVMKPLAGGAIKNIETAFRFFASYPVDVILNGVANVRELKHNVTCFDSVEPLSAEELKALEEEVAPLGKVFCRRCGYCMPCRNDIIIPIFVQNIWQTVKGWTLEKLSEEKKSVAKNVLAWLEACEECGECEQKCPYDMPIIERKRELMEMLGKQ